MEQTASHTVMLEEAVEPGERVRWDNNMFVLMERAGAEGEGGHSLGDPLHKSEGLAPAGTGSDRHASLATCGVRQVQRQGGGGCTSA